MIFSFLCCGLVLGLVWSSGQTLNAGRLGSQTRYASCQVLPTFWRFALLGSQCSPSRRALAQPKSDNNWCALVGFSRLLFSVVCGFSLPVIRQEIFPNCKRQFSDICHITQSGSRCYAEWSLRTAVRPLHSRANHYGHKVRELNKLQKHEHCPQTHTERSTYSPKQQQHQHERGMWASQPWVALDNSNKHGHDRYTTNRTKIGSTLIGVDPMPMGSQTHSGYRRWGHKYV